MIYLIRHGQTELNCRRVIQGRSDYPLNENGIAQAREAAKKLNGIAFDAVYSSPLIRAIQTAKLIAPDAVPLMDDRLTDMDYGPYEGVGINALPREVSAYFRDFVHKPAPEGMEQLGSVMRRAGAFLDERCRTGGNILIVTHAIIMKGLLEHMTPEAFGSFWPRHMGNCALYAASYAPGDAWSVPAEL